MINAGAVGSYLMLSLFLYLLMLLIESITVSSVFSLKSGEKIIVKSSVLANIALSNL